MAIKDMYGNYIKVDLHKTYISTSGMYVSYEQYSSEDARKCEKERKEVVTEFVNKLSSKVNVIYNEFLAVLASRGITEENISNYTDDKGYFLMDYPDLRQLQANLSDWDADYRAISTHCFQYSNEPRAIKKIQELMSMGFKMEWLDKPLSAPSNGTKRVENVIYPLTIDAIYGEFKRLYPNHIDC